MLTIQPAGLGNVNARSMSRWSTHPMIMRDMDRALTMNPAMVDMRNIRSHWVDRSVWTETLGAAGRRRRPVAPLTNVPTTVDIEAKPPPFQTSIQPNPAGHHEQ